MPDLNDAPREVAQSVSQSSQRPAAGARKVHPMVIVAAGAVTVFSAVGVAVMTGIIPSAQSSNSSNRTAAQQTAAPASTSMPAATAAGAAMAGVGNVADSSLPANPAGNDRNLKPIESSTVGQPMARAEARVDARSEAKPEPKQETRVAAKPAPVHNTKPQVVAQNNPRLAAVPGSSTERSPTPVYVQQPAPTAPVANNPPINVNLPPDNAPRVAVSEPCRTCGTIDSVTPIAQQGQGSGAGAVLGGVLGGVLGHQVGQGRGKDVATVAGAVGGAVLGNTIEKNSKTTQSYEVRVRMEDGTFQTVRFDAEPAGIRIGDKVRVENGRIVR
jgi:outer membrane lipoprotein SlyB